MHGYKRSESGKAKAEPGSTRWVYNTFLRRQTKLRWVCGLCNVWCKDENGFKCHLQHENHILKSEQSRQSKAREFDVTPRDEAFAARFVEYLAQNYCDQKVLLHDVYREMYPEDSKTQRLIGDTCWGTLGTFINAMSRAGECEAVRGPKGWVVRVGMDMLVAAEEEKSAREASAGPSRDAVEASGSSCSPAVPAPEEQASCLLAMGDVPAVAVPKSRRERMQSSWASSLHLRDARAPGPAEDDGGARRAAAQARAARRAAAGAAEAGGRPGAGVPGAAAGRAAEEPHASAVDLTGDGAGLPAAPAARVAFRLRGAAAGEAAPGPASKRARRAHAAAADAGAPVPPPLLAGLVVKVTCAEALGGLAAGRKAVTLEPCELGAGVLVRLLLPEGSGRAAGACTEELRVRRERLQTVLPKLGGRVLVLPGAEDDFAGEAVLRSLEADSFSCTVVLPGGGLLRGLPYERVCKLLEAAP